MLSNQEPASRSKACFLCEAGIYDDEPIIFQARGARAIMDRYPLAEGHTLLFPERHLPDIFTLPDTQYLDLMVAARSLADAVSKTFNVSKVGMFVAGKEHYEHAHMHIVPLRLGLKDLFTELSTRERPELPLSRRHQLARLIASNRLVPRKESS